MKKLLGTFYGEPFYSDEKEKIKEVIARQIRLKASISEYDPDMKEEIQTNIDLLKLELM